MRMYVIGFMVGVIGLVAANQVRADEPCGLRSHVVFKVAHWDAEKSAAGRTHVSVYLRSLDPKPISDVSGSVEFFAGGRSLLSRPIKLNWPVRHGSLFVIDFDARDPAAVIRDGAGHLNVQACVADITYADGSGTIIN